LGATKMLRETKGIMGWKSLKTSGIYYGCQNYNIKFSNAVKKKCINNSNKFYLTMKYT